MANNRFTYQQLNNVSIPRRDIIDIAGEAEFKQADYRVLFALFSTLDGWVASATRARDPKNFKAIKFAQIGELTGLSKKEVRNSIEKLLRRQFIEKGSNDTVTDGYRFLF